MKVFIPCKNTATLDNRAGYISKRVASSLSNAPVISSQVLADALRKRSAFAHGKYDQRLQFRPLFLRVLSRRDNIRP